MKPPVSLRSLPRERDMDMNIDMGHVSMHRRQTRTDQPRQTGLDWRRGVINIVPV